MVIKKAKTSRSRSNLKKKKKGTTENGAPNFEHNF